jgi:hypothetical protein
MGSGAQVAVSGLLGGIVAAVVVEWESPADIKFGAGSRRMNPLHVAGLSYRSQQSVISVLGRDEKMRGEQRQASNKSVRLRGSKDPMRSSAKSRFLPSSALRLRPWSWHANMAVAKR